MTQNTLHPPSPRSGGVREMIAIALPMVVSQACDTVMVFTDRLFLAKLGPVLMSAAMGGGLTAFMMMSFFLGLTGYTTALAAQYLGAGRKDRCPVVVTQAVLVSLAAYGPILLCRPLALRFFSFMGVSPEQMAPQTVYFDILLYGCLIGLLRNCLSCFFSGIGRTGIVMLASCAAMTVNVALNYVLIFGHLGFPALGIRGAAYGTLIGGLSGLLILAGAYFGPKIRAEFRPLRALRPDREVFGKLLRFGSSTGAEFFLNLLAFDALILMFHAHGPATAAAATIVFNWDMVSFVPLIGVEIGVMSLVGRFMGAGSPDTAHRSVMSGLKLGLVYSAVIFVLFVGFPAQMVELFRPAGVDEIFPQAAPLAVFMIRVAALYVLVEAMFIVFIGALRGAGDTFWAMKMSVSLHWLMVAILYVTLHLLGLSPETGWVVMVLLFLVFSLLIFRRYHAGEWKKIRVVQPDTGPMVGDGFHETADL